MKPISKTTWKNFTGKQRWDCLVALRGPDCARPECIKWFTTAVIRHGLSEAMRVGGMVNDRLGCVILPGCGPRVSGNTFHLAHFIQHTYEAAEILNIPVLVLGHGSWDNAIRKGSKLDTGLAFYKAIMPPPQILAIHDAQASRIELRRYLIEDCKQSEAVALIEKGDKGAKSV